MIKRSLVLSTVLVGLVLGGCDSSSSSTNDNNTIAVDGYIIDLGGSKAEANCSGTVYESSDIVGLKGRISFPDIKIDSNCIITIPKTAIIDIDNDGDYNSTTDTAIGFEMQSFGDMTYTSHMTSLAVLDPTNEDLANLVKGFNPVEDVEKAVDDVKFQKLFILGEIVKNIMKNNYTSELLNLTINIAEIENDDINTSSFDINSLTSNISNDDLKTIIKDRANIIKGVIEILKDLKDDVNIQDMFIKISDKQEEPSIAIEATILDNSDKTIDDIKNDISTISELDTLHTEVKTKIENLAPADETDEAQDILDQLSPPNMTDLNDSTDNNGVDTNVTDLSDLNPPQQTELNQ
jgi:hypothetical protein